MCRVSIFTKFDRHFKFSFQTEFHIEFYRITQKLVMKFSMIHKNQYSCIFPFFYHLRSQFEILRDVKITNIRTIKIFVNKHLRRGFNAFKYLRTILISCAGECILESNCF